MLHLRAGSLTLVLRVVLPKGSLERVTLELFEQADLAVTRSSDVDYRGTIDDPRVTEVKILRPQEIPRYVAEGLFDIGVTGRDWVEETRADVVSLGELRYSKASSRPVKIVLAVAEDSPVRSVADLAASGTPVRVSTEYVELTRRFLEEHGVKAEIMLSYGATEAKVPDIADVVVDITETGRALRAAKLRVIETMLTSYTELIANPVAHEDPDKRHAMHQLQTLLQGVLEARGKVLVKLNVAEPNLATVIDLLPSMKSPTVSKLFGDDAYAVETVVPKARINTLIPALRDAGATDILEIPLSKIVH
jgi:ATP phosphoribosyltransferase